MTIVSEKSIRHEKEHLITGTSFYEVYDTENEKWSIDIISCPSCDALHIVESYHFAYDQKLEHDEEGFEVARQRLHLMMPLSDLAKPKDENELERSYLTQIEHNLNKCSPLISEFFEESALSSASDDIQKILSFAHQGAYNDGVHYISRIVESILRKLIQDKELKKEHPEKSSLKDINKLNFRKLVDLFSEMIRPQKNENLSRLINSLRDIRDKRNKIEHKNYDQSPQELSLEYLAEMCKVLQEFIGEIRALLSSPL